jgi:putative membrane protein
MTSSSSSTATATTATPSTPTPTPILRVHLDMNAATVNNTTINKHTANNSNTNFNNNTQLHLHPHHHHHIHAHAHPSEAEAAAVQGQGRAVSSSPSSTDERERDDDDDIDTDMVHDQHNHSSGIFSRIPLLWSTPTAAPTEFQKSPSSVRSQAHLALERTYLAWMTSALTIIPLGIACSRFGGIDSESGGIAVTTRSLIAGALLVGFGGLIIIYSSMRYKRINNQLQAGYFIVGSRGIEVPIFSIVTLGVFLAAMLLLFL